MKKLMKINSEYIVLAGSDVVKIKVLDITVASIRVHNLDDNFVKRYLLEDYKPRVIEEISKVGDISDSFMKSVIEGAYLPTSDFGILISPSNHGNFVEAFTKHLEHNEDKILQTSALGKSNAERLAEILNSSSQEKEIEELVERSKEVWREIPNMGHPYMLSSKGKVKNHHNRLLKPSIRGAQRYYQLVKKDRSTRCVNVNELLNDIFGLKRVS